MVHQQVFKVAEVEVSYKPNYSISERPIIRSSNDTYSLLIQQWDDGKINFIEEFKLLLMNRCNRVLGIVNLSMGGVSGTVVDTKVMFATALKANASAIILAHNHPSESLKPSDADIKLTRRLVECGKLLDINVLDHLIVTRSSYYSFADECMM